MFRPSRARIALDVFLGQAQIPNRPYTIVASESSDRVNDMLLLSKPQARYSELIDQDDLK